MSPDERLILEDFIKKNEIKKKGLSLKAMGSDAVNSKKITNCNGYRKIDIERKIKEAEIRK